MKIVPHKKKWHLSTLWCPVLLWDCRITHTLFITDRKNDVQNTQIRKSAIDRLVIIGLAAQRLSMETLLCLPSVILEQFLREISTTANSELLHDVNHKS